MYFYGMTDDQVNTFILSLPYPLIHCINGKAFHGYNEHNERVLVLRAGVVDIYIGNKGEAVFDLRQVRTSEGIRDEEEEFREELEICQKIFIPFGTVNLQPRGGSKVKNEEYNSVPWDERPLSKLPKHGLHQALLVIERGKDGTLDRWLKFDAMITKGTIIRKSARNRYYYNTVRKLLLGRYDAQASGVPAQGQSVKVGLGWGVMNYCSLLVCRVIEDLIPKRYEEGYDPTVGLLAYSKKVIARLRQDRHIVGGRLRPEEYERQRALEVGNINRENVRGQRRGKRKDNRKVKVKVSRKRRRDV
ncbi:unnamed protein product [Orchesella dallaii]|uniref:Uncharacterized protein n=1 Tax=Orchesella dallaii TaxID=48710 RepID=A0ABP1RV52_9HEXA